jgi:hypothetical protein
VKPLDKLPDLRSRAGRIGVIGRRVGAAGEEDIGADRLGPELGRDDLRQAD